MLLAAIVVSTTWRSVTPLVLDSRVGVRRTWSQHRCQLGQPGHRMDTDWMAPNLALPDTWHRNRWRWLVQPGSTTGS